MRYILAIFWAVLISGAISYVLTSMGGEPFVLMDSLILAGIFSVAVFLLGDGVLTDKN
ncbi:DUF2929 family protein [Oceanobacillus halophilus]|uniref:DUF2929 family protein n=1 Tax=Oceanobacillus halophilus TaxID=930130 RepID=A0A495A0I6_9BACI|nr:DUF2929 family protein [Oceanobacillus halophilus]RKQ32617.1 DUF2929 family protein [Oceanobacillus halophilus]